MIFLITFIDISYSDVVITVGAMEWKTYRTIQLTPPMTFQRGKYFYSKLLFKEKKCFRVDFRVNCCYQQPSIEPADWWALSSFIEIIKLLWNCSETALKLLWNCSKTALKPSLKTALKLLSKTALKLLWNCSLKLLWNCSKTAL